MNTQAPTNNNGTARNIIIGIVILMILCCCASTVIAAVALWPRNAVRYSPPVIVPVSPAEPATAPQTWDNTCVTQSTLVGVTLKPLAEGAFFACVWHGSPTKISVPADMYADLDKGGIFVAAGPVEVPGVANLTLRPWDSGKTDEICSHLKDLKVFGAKQSKPFTPSLWNKDFTCQ